MALSSHMRVAAVQFPLEENGQPKNLLEKIERFIQEAKQSGADLVVFPELITTELVFWDRGLEETRRQLSVIADEFTPNYIDWIKSKSLQHSIAILGGTTPRRVGGDIVNTAIYADQSDRLILQDKIFLTPDEKVWGWRPGESMQVFRTQWGKTVIATCFDCEFPVISHALVPLKPDLILVPSWTGTESGLNRVGWSAQARAVEHYAFVVKTGTIPGPGATQSHFGKASIVTPQETGFPITLIEGTLNRAEMVLGDLNFEMLHAMKGKSGYYPGKEQSQRIARVEVTDVSQHTGDVQINPHQLPSVI